MAPNTCAPGDGPIILSKSSINSLPEDELRQILLHNETAEEKGCA